MMRSFNQVISVKGEKIVKTVLEVRMLYEFDIERQLPIAKHRRFNRYDSLRARQKRK